jgi:hypothetical protein
MGDRRGERRKQTSWRPDTIDDDSDEPPVRFGEACVAPRRSRRTCSHATVKRARPPRSGRPRQQRGAPQMALTAPDSRQGTPGASRLVGDQGHVAVAEPDQRRVAYAVPQAVTDPPHRVARAARATPPPAATTTRGLGGQEGWTYHPEPAGSMCPAAAPLTERVGTAATGRTRRASATAAGGRCAWQAPGPRHPEHRRMTRWASEAVRERWPPRLAHPPAMRRQRKAMGAPPWGPSTRGRAQGACRRRGPQNVRPARRWRLLASHITRVLNSLEVQAMLAALACTRWRTSRSGPKPSTATLPVTPRPRARSRECRRLRTARVLVRARLARNVFTPAVPWLGQLQGTTLAADAQSLSMVNLEHNDQNSFFCQRLKCGVP